MSDHSTLVGGSTAGRLLACPGSWQATIKLPPAADRPSEYAEEGTFAHAVMARLMILRSHVPDPRNFNMFVAVRGLVGLQFHDRELTKAHLDDMIEPAIVALAQLEKEYGGDFAVAGVEQRVAFPGIPGAFGTVDLILANKTTMLHVDWKFGQGIPVKAIYSDPAGDLVNAQLMFYLVSAKNSLRRLYAGKSKLVVSIIQPRTADSLSHTEVSPQEVRWFTKDMQRAVVAATRRDPPRTRGEHCRFAPCKVDCPLWTGPLLDLTALGPEYGNQLDVAVSREVTPYAQYLARAKTLADLADQFKKEIDEQIHGYLEAGGTVPGWRLKAKVKQRQWVDEDKVVKSLCNQGMTLDEIMQTKLGTFAQVEAAARRRKIKIPDDLRVAPPTNETTVCATDDPAPIVNRQLAVEMFRAALADLTKQAAEVTGREQVTATGTGKGK